MIQRALRLEEARNLAAEGRALGRYERAVQEGSEDVEARWTEIQVARANIVDLTARIRRDAKAQAELLYPEAATLERIQATLSSGEVLVLYGLQASAVALVIQPKAARIVSLGDAARIEAASEALASSIRQPGARGLQRAPHKQHPYLVKRLRALIIEPLGLPEGTKRLLVSPQGILSYLPFELIAPQGAEVAYVPSGTTLELLRSTDRTNGKAVLALGDPKYDVEAEAGEEGTPRGAVPLAALPGSGREARAVGDVLLLAERATIAGLKEALARQPRWRALHLACHGLVDSDQPILSSLALTPGTDDTGLLRCLEIYRLEIPADLVVLSACETGKGRIHQAEGIVGLTRAFMFAGTPRVICSLWKVDDKATSALMTKFYELWNPRTKSGETERPSGAKPLSAAAALKQAQAHIRS